MTIIIVNQAISLLDPSPLERAKASDLFTQSNYISASPVFTTSEHHCDREETSARRKYFPAPLLCVALTCLWQVSDPHRASSTGSPEEPSFLGKMRYFHPQKRGHPPPPPSATWEKRQPGCTRVKRARSWSRLKAGSLVRKNKATPSKQAPGGILAGNSKENQAMN